MGGIDGMEPGVSAVATAASGVTVKNSDPKIIGGEVLNDGGEVLDDSVVDTRLPEKQWEALNDQRNKLIKFMILTFGCLNAAMIAIVLIGICVDQSNISQPNTAFTAADRIIGSTVINALIAATVAQAGLAFITITKFLFPTGANAP